MKIIFPEVFESYSNNTDTEHGRLAFTEGIRWGFQLHTELTQPEVQ